MNDLYIRCGSSRSRATITAISLVEFEAAGHDHQGWCARTNAFAASMRRAAVSSRQ